MALSPQGSILHFHCQPRTLSSLWDQSGTTALPAPAHSTARAPLVHPQVQGRRQAGGDGGGPIFFFVAQVLGVGW